jgi:uncharacterized protein YjdB
MRKMKLCSLAISILLSSLILGTGNELIAKTFYVAPSGNNGNPGNIGSPFLSIQHGVDFLRAGDSLVVRAGTYHEKVTAPYDGTASEPIVISSYPGEFPVIDGQGNLPAGSWNGLVEIRGNYVYFNGFEVKNSNTNGSWEGGAGVLLIGQHDKVSHCNVHNSWENGVLILGDYGIAEYNTVHDNCLANENDKAVTHSSGLTAARDLLDGITTGAIIRGNIVYGNWGEGLSSYETNGTLIEDNITYDNDAYDLYISDAPNTICQRNLIYSVSGQLNAWGGLVIGDELADKPRTTNIKVINNCLYRSSFWAFNSTNVRGAGLNGAYIEYNTLIDSQFKVGANATDGVVNTSGYIRNNIFSNSLADPWAQAGPLTNITMNHNFWSTLPPSDFRGTGDLTGDAGVSKTGSTGTGGLTGNYFKLLSTSSAINKGLLIDNITQDYFSNTRDNLPDIGALEYITSNQAIKVTAIAVTSVNGTNVISTDKGTLQLNAIISPSDATNKTVAWSIQNGTGQASISTSGSVTAISNGTVTAMATANDGSGVYGTFIITISVVVVPVTTSPNAPSGLNALATSSTSISLTWQDNSSDETGFEIYHSTTSGSGFTLLTTTGASVTSFSHTGLTASNTHYYKVRSINGQGNSAFTSEASATTLSESSGSTIVRSDGCGIITAGGLNSGSETPDMAFDNLTSTKWHNLNTIGVIWIKYQFCNGASYAINSFSITSANDFPLRDPKTVRLYGSKDGSHYTLLYSKTNIVFTARLQTQTFRYRNFTAYQYYRFDMIANSGNDGLQVSEIELIQRSTTFKSTESVTLKEGLVTVSPNPFRESLTIDYNLPEDTHVNLVVYDLNGRIVKQLVNEDQVEGSHRIVWDALNSIGGNLHNGIYLLKIESSFGMETSKIIYME